MFARKVHDLRHLGFRYLVRIDAAFSDPMVMYMQHNSCGSFMIFAEEPLQHMHNELHRRVIIIENEYTIQVRPFGLRFGLGNDRCARPALLIPAFTIVVGHPGRVAPR